MHSDEPLSIVLWEDTDGIYMFDGRKPLKVSPPIDHFFNVEYSTAIEASKINNCQAFIDRLNNEYHFLVPYSASQDAIELIYNYVTDEWYPPWKRRCGGANAYLVTGLGFRGTDDRVYTYAANDSGKIYRLETDTSDKNNSEEDVAIEHFLKTRAIAAEQELGPIVKFNLRCIWPELKTRKNGDIVVSIYKNQAIDPDDTESLSMASSGYNITNPNMDLSMSDCTCFQAKLSLDEVDQEMEIYAITYELEHIGVLGK